MEIIISRIIGKKIVETKQQECGSVSDSKLMPLIEKRDANGKVYLVNSDGREVTKRKYDEIGDFKNGLAKVRLAEKEGYIDQNGNEIVKLIYSSVGDFKNGLAVVQNLNGYYGYIDENGYPITEIKYAAADDFKNGLAVVYGRHGYGCIDKNGNEVVKLKYKSIGGFKNGIALVEDRGVRTGCIGADGKILVKPSSQYHAIYISEGCILVKRYRGRALLATKDGKRVSLKRYTEVGYFDHGMAPVAKKGLMELDSRWGFIDTKGKELTPTIYYKVACLGNGFAKVKRGGLWTIIDGSGAEIFPPTYDEISLLSDGLFCVQNCGNWGIIDAKGNEIVPTIYDGIYGFHNGLAIVCKENFGAIDRKGNVIINLEYQEIRPFNDKYLLIKKNGKYGLINNKGQIIADCIYSAIRMQDDEIEFSFMSSSDEDSYTGEDSIRLSQNEFSYDILIQHGNKKIFKEFSTFEERDQYYHILKKEVDNTNDKYQEIAKRLEEVKTAQMEPLFEQMSEKVKSL